MSNAALSNRRDLRPRRSARDQLSLAVPLLLLIAAGCTPDQPSSGGGTSAGAPPVALKVRILPTRGGVEVTPLPTEPGQIDVEILQDALDIDIEAVPDIGHAPLTVRFSAVLSNPPSAPLSYDWDFGDGGHATENPTTHTYTAAGQYTAMLAVSDSTGQRGDSDVEIQVDPAEDSGAK